ncbi:MAG: M56 family metallopeptidase [Acidobacteriota bacterium]
MTLLDGAINIVTYWLQLAIMIPIALWIAHRARRWPTRRLRLLRFGLALIVTMPVMQIVVALGAQSTTGAALGVEGLSIDVTAALAERGGVLPNPWVVAILGALALVALWRLGLIALGLIALNRLVRDARPIDLTGLVDIEAVSTVRTLVSDRTRSPVTFGWRRPVILVPPSVADLSIDAQRAVVLHEVLHIERRDWPSVVAEEIVRALLWFQPLVGRLLDELSLAREQVVDARVVHQLGCRRPYLDALLTFTTGTTSTPAGMPRVAVSMLERTPHLLARVDHLIQETPMSTHRTHRSLIALVLLAAAVTILVPMTSMAHPEKEIHRVDGDVEKPIRIAGDVATYPDQARADRVEGKVVVETVIDTDGRIVSKQVVQSLRHDVDQAALDVLDTWRFKPARLDGEPVEVFYNLTFNFRLDKNKESKSADG